MQTHKLAANTLAAILALVSVAAIQLLLNSGRIEASEMIRHVAPGGDCGGASPCYASIQAAIDAAADGDRVKIAQGTYTSTGFQLASISRSVIMMGGFTTTDWINSYPATQSTVLDAENGINRRGLYIDVAQQDAVDISGITIQRASSGGHGSGAYIHGGAVTFDRCRFLSNMAITAAGNEGGAIFSISGTLSVKNSHFQGNHASSTGGAIHIEDGFAQISSSVFVDNHSYGGGAVYATVLSSLNIDGNTFLNNEAAYGGALMVQSGYGIVTDKVIEGNLYDSNHAHYSGGGAEIRGNAVLSGNVFTRNDTWGSGGGAAISGMCCGPAIIQANTFESNVAEYGGGISLSPDDGYMRANLILSNTATYGGGLYIAAGRVSGQNDVIAGNHATLAGIYISQANETVLSARHWTVAMNGQYGIFSDGGQVILTNTIVTSHSVAGLWGSGIRADHTLGFENGALCDNGATCSSSLDGDPRFLDPESSDFHIGAQSVAYNAGIPAGVAVDLDGEVRPMCGQYDIGADELAPLAPAAAFEAPDFQWLGRQIVFTNTTDFAGCIDYEWQFGDGATATSTHPAHIYASAGEYTVVLLAANDAGTSAYTRTILIGAAKFETDARGWVGNAVSFTNTTITSGTTTYRWSFGDGGFSEQEQPAHIYSTTGIYTITLTVTNTYGTDTASSPVTIYSRPSARFGASPVQGIRSFTVAFINATTTTPHGDSSLVYTWQFGDGATSYLANPSHTYVAAGVYTVSLSASNVAGSDVITQSRCITVTPIPAHADFYALPIRGVVPVMVAFINNSTGDYTESVWDFGDGITSTEPNPFHTYTAVGTYTVTLTATGPGVSDVRTRASYITVRMPPDITPESGGTKVFTGGLPVGMAVTITFPPGAVTEPVDLIFTPINITTTDSSLLVVGQGFELEALTMSSVPVHTFQQPLTITISYAGQNLKGVPETDLKLYYYNSAGMWAAIPTTVNTIAKTLTANLDHLSVFSVLGRPWMNIFVPVIGR